jgi:hypothetical protein
MSRRSFIAACAMAAAIWLPGCALFSGHPCESAYRFPERFALLQVISVEQDGRQMQLLASVRRAGHDFELVMLDPIIQRPLVEASLRGGVWSEKSSLPAGTNLKVRDLFDAIRQLFEGERFTIEDGGLVFRGDRFRFRMDEPSPGACAFPKQIVMVPRAGNAVRVSVETQDVSCVSEQSD